MSLTQKLIADPLPSGEMAPGREIGIRIDQGNRQETSA